MAKDLFSRFWRGVMVLCLVTAALIAPSGRADAFGGASIEESRALGTCTVEFSMDATPRNAKVFLTSSREVGGEAVYMGGGRFNGYAPVSVSALNNCGITNVSDLVHTGPTASFETDDYLGFTFTGTEGGVVHSYEYALKGATATTVQPTSTAPASSVSSLSSLTLSGITLTPAFDPSVTHYNVTVASTVTGTTVTAVVTDPTSTVKINEDTATDIGLNPGLNTIVVEVTAQNTSNYTAYEINVTREAAPPPPPSTDATLSGLTLSGITLTPAFAADVTAYTATVALDVADTTVTATANQSNATLTVGGSPVTSGAGVGFGLNSGTNTVRVEVTAQDGTTKKTYEVAVTRPEPNRAPVANPGYSGGQAGQTVTLNGGNSVDPDTVTNAGLTYAWRQTGSPPTVTLTDADKMDATFTAPTLDPGVESLDLTFELTVSDGELSNTRSVTVTIFAPRILPPEDDALAVAKVLGKTAVNGTYSLTSGETVTLSAADSSLPDGPTPTYSWATDAPGVTFGSPDAETTSFTAPVVTEPTTVEVVLNIGFGKRVIEVDFAPLSSPALDFDDIDPPGDAGMRAVLTIVVMPTEIGTPEPAPSGDEAEAARKAVQTFVQTRTSLVLSNQPDMDDMLLPGVTDGTANLTVSSMGGQADLSTAPDRPVWLRLKGAWSTVDGAEGGYILGSVGAHLVQGNGFAFGIMAQVDHLKTVDGLSVGEGTGWLAGPYGVVALQSYPVTVQGRLLYGTTDNSLSPTGTFDDRFSGDRLLALLGVSGEVPRGKLTLKPTLTAGYVRETTDAYVNGAGIAVPETETALIQIAPGIEIRFPVEVSSGSLQLTFGLADVWSRSVSGDAPSYEGHRGRINAGLTRVYSSGAMLSANASYDGIGTPSYESLSVDLRYEHRF